MLGKQKMHAEFFIGNLAKQQHKGEESGGMQILKLPFSSESHIIQFPT
jgi:hypothetical protein